MPRRHCRRRIGVEPRCTRFRPCCPNRADSKEVTLQLDELESMRLSDLQGLYHKEAADKMTVSRQTFDRIISSARRKIADALLNGHPLNIEGGNVMIYERTFDCHDCKHIWSLPHGAARPDACPKCNSKNIHRAPQQKGPRRGCCHGKGRRFSPPGGGSRGR